uniref:glycoside hydrolase family 18 protein n=1 Tax=uncultured Draconibacterium sp. TaxID=1573823 RepID=UPI003216FCC6
MNKLIALFLILTMHLSCSQQQNRKTTNTDSPVNIMAYYVAERDYHPELLPLEKLTHIIFSFSKVIDGEMKFRREESGRKLELLTAQREKYPYLKVMIACGGWGADGFSDAVLTEESRQKFVKSAIAFIEKYRLDGMDVDWEYPGISGAGTKARPDEDKENFTQLMRLLREELDKLDRPQTLRFASAGWKRYYDFVNLDEVMKYADFMNVMTYDQAGGASRMTTHHTALGHRSVDDLAGTPLGEAMKKRNEELPPEEHKWEPQSAEKIINFCIDKGVNPEQIVIGAAFYGRGWKGVPPANNGLYQPNTGAISGGTSYADLLTDYINKEGYDRHWDSIAKAPFIYSVADSVFITYDDPESVKLKTKYAKDMKLGGIMFWQLSSDTKEENSLLNAIYEEATQ